ncbi:MAG: type II toxin-antitoxin system RelE/ParE family toxin [Bacteroidia bacterium]|nr:type II toxin-antitoxin system RelE/ParE family toxin [Bacteroidia bacterium]
MPSDLAALGNELQANPTQGVHLGRQVYKIRLAITSKGRGKSGGARVITLVVHVTTTVYLLTLYDKSDVSSLTDTEIDFLINQAEQFLGSD